MFSANQAMMTDGKVFVNGGRNMTNSPYTSHGVDPADLKIHVVDRQPVREAAMIRIGDGRNDAEPIE